MLAATTWPDVGLAVAASLPGLAAAIIAYLNRRQIRTPSGDTLGAVAERTHDISHATGMAVTRMENGRAHPETPTPTKET